MTDLKIAREMHGQEGQAAALRIYDPDLANESGRHRELETVGGYTILWRMAIEVQVQN